MELPENPRDQQRGKWANQTLGGSIRVESYSKIRSNTDSTFLLDLTAIVLAVRGASLSIHGRYPIHRGLKPRLYLNCGSCPQSGASDRGCLPWLVLDGPAPESPYNVNQDSD
jgi:hypothetical protein